MLLSNSEAKGSSSISKEFSKKPPEVLPPQHSFVGHSRDQNCYAFYNTWSSRQECDLQPRCTASPSDVGATSRGHFDSQ